MSGIKIYAAPLQGYTTAPWRHFHAELAGAVDAYFMPFVRLEKGDVRSRDLRELTSPLNDNHAIVPQIIFRDADEFRKLVDTVAGIGFRHIDLNIGCPFPPQVKHGRGAGLLLRPDVLANIAEVIACDYTHIQFSAKMRLGVDSADDWRAVLSVLNQIPLSHLTVHPRVARQQYGGTPDMVSFGEILSASVHPVVYNGDLHTPADIAALVRACPAVCGVMLGRGLLERPSLAAEFRSGSDMEPGQRLSLSLSLHDRLVDYYSDTLCGDAQILSHIKAFWEFPPAGLGHKAVKVLRKATALKSYRAAWASVNQEYGQ